MSLSRNHTSAPALVCAGLGFAWRDGTPVLAGFDLTVGPGRTGLVGLNGSGKSTLLKLLAGVLVPQDGSVRATGEIGYLPQDATLDTALRVDAALGVAEARAALHAIEAGDADAGHFAAVGDDWDVEERARATLDQLGLEGIGLDRTVGELSGGETVLLRLAALLLRRPDVLLLDEPTNNLDREARRHLHDAVDAWPGVLVVVSHDRELLERVDRIAELRDGRVRWFGGNFTAYQDQLAAEQDTAERLLRVAESDVKRQRRDLAEDRIKQATRDRQGRKAAANGLPKMVIHARRRAAQETAGRNRQLHEDRLHSARERLKEAEEAVRDDDLIRVDLPATEVPDGRQVLTVRELTTRHGITGLDLDIRGPERIALLGRNGSGKSTLLRTLIGELAAAGGGFEAHVPVRHLPQRLDERVLDDRLSVVENAARHAPGAGNNAMRARLARFLFRGARADQQAGTLSGGERFRAALAALMLAEPAPQLLLLDEPTNNLDLGSVRQLTAALAAYRGALVVAGHDVTFLREVGITRWLRVEEGRLVRVDPDDV
ncbi:ABC transporter [Mangrovactinospora gilvigrisea]|uniref:ABC transporter n=1 Tax=Mangrovactinospora gilvigrisea TaxID=1428644 RepID=A0A1J7BAV0_9ACTN|nr:ATP-binding cassette domain-containing protein [Mangrovactinospora gilvigrisea]OIV35742.1 ABC transporter [Mangrovactinospora gilvigrisea]